MSSIASLFGGGGGAYRPSAYSDEFNGSGSAWTAWTDIPGSTVDFGSTTPSRVHMQHATIITRPGLPAFPFTVEAYCASIAYDNVATTPGNATLGLGTLPTDVSHGAFYGLEWDIDTPGFIGQYDGKFVPMFGATPVHFGSIQNNTAGHVNEVPHWQRIIAHSATNLDLEWSKNGVDWTRYISGVNPGITLNTLYIVSFACVTEWEYVRFR